MPKYRKKPVVIEAVQWSGKNWEDIFKFCEDASWLDMQCKKLWIKTLEGGHEANVGDFIIKGIVGEFYPCKPDVFEKTYERVFSESSLEREARGVFNEGDQG